MVTAGDLMPKEVVHKMYAHHPSAQIHILYGSTESCEPVISCGTPSDEEGAIGVPLPSVQLSLEEEVAIQAGATLFEELWEGNHCTHRVHQWTLSRFSSCRSVWGMVFYSSIDRRIENIWSSGVTTVD